MQRVLGTSSARENTKRKRILQLHRHIGSMTVEELKRELSRYPKDAKVYLVKDWDAIENGVLTDLAELTGVSSQIEVVDNGLDFEDLHEVLLEFEEQQ